MKSVCVSVSVCVRKRDEKCVCVTRDENCVFDVRETPGYFSSLLVFVLSCSRFKGRE